MDNTEREMEEMGMFVTDEKQINEDLPAGEVGGPEEDSDEDEEEFEEGEGEDDEDEEENDKYDEADE